MTLCRPLKPYRILRNAGPCAVYYATRAARDAAARRWANRTGAHVVTELWAADRPHDAINRGWACDGVVRPEPTVTVTLNVENHYELYDMVVTTPTVTVPAPPELGDTDAHSEWAGIHIFNATGTGTGRTQGDSWYFVRVTASTMPELVGREYEFGV